MQGIVLGMTGSGKTKLLKNIVTQDLARVVGTPNDHHRQTMVISDDKGDLELFYDLLPHVHRAGRLHQLRVLNPARPDISVRYNLLYCSDENYMSVVNMVLGSFNLHDEFCAKHQLNYGRPHAAGWSQPGDRCVRLRGGYNRGGSHNGPANSDAEEYTCFSVVSYAVWLWQANTGWYAA